MTSIYVVGVTTDTNHTLEDFPYSTLYIDVV